MSLSESSAQDSANFGQITPFPRRKVAQESGARLAREAKRTAQLAETLPRGITIGFRADGREQPFYVRFGPKRSTESYATEKERNDRAEKLAESVREEGRGVLDFDAAEWKRLRQFKERTGVTLDEAEEIVMRVRGNLRLNMTTSEAVARFYALVVDEGLPKESRGHVRLHLERLCEFENSDRKELGVLPLYAITPDHVREWMADLKHRGFGPATLKHHRKDGNALFDRAVREKWCVDNPFTVVPPPKVPVQKTRILTPEEIFGLLKANANEPAVGRLVFELFGAMRCSSVQRMSYADVKPAVRGVLMHGKHVDASGEMQQGHKSGEGKWRQGHPPVLWAWVQHCCPLPQPQEGPACFVPLSVRSYQYWKLNAFMRAGWRHIPHNRLRHCFASYMLAVTKDRRLVSHLMQHTSWKMLERYEGIAEEMDGMMVLSMTPEAVLLSWEQFQARWRDFYQPVSATPTYE